MAVVCDRCLARNSHPVGIVFQKRDKLKGKGSVNQRQILMVPMDLCEHCINEFLKAFGKFKSKWIKEPDEVDNVES